MASPEQAFDIRESGRFAPSAGKLGLAKDEAGTKNGLVSMLECVGARA